MDQYLITIADFRRFIDIPPSLETVAAGANMSIYDSQIKPKVLEAQDIDLYKALGKELHFDFMEVAGTGVDAVSGNLTKANYDLLLPYVKDMLVYYAFARFIPESNLSITRSGIKVQDKTDSNTMSSKQRDDWVVVSRSKGYQKYLRMAEYLQDNNNKFVKWTNKYSPANGFAISGI